MRAEFITAMFHDIRFPLWRRLARRASLTGSLIDIDDAAQVSFADAYQPQFRHYDIFCCVSRRELTDIRSFHLLLPFVLYIAGSRRDYRSRHDMRLRGYFTH